jgi:uncharacterized protein (DUF2147 family)
MKKITILSLIILLCGSVAFAQSSEKSQSPNASKRTSMAAPSVLKNAKVVKRAVTANPADDICGIYLVNSPKNKVDKIKVKVTRTTNGTYQGRVIWLVPSTNADGSVRTDQLNKDKSLRNRKATDITLCWNLKYDTKDKMWKDGVLYDPTSGKTFSVQLKKAGNGKDVDARYYKGTPALGMDQVWKQSN